MWAKNFKDFPQDAPLKREEKLINGCEMHEIYGWGEKFQHERFKKTFIRRLLEALFLKDNPDDKVRP